MKKGYIPLAAAILHAIFFHGAALADEARSHYLYIVGSTTVQPYTEEVGNRIAKGGKHKHPLIESNGTNGGFTMFCEGVGVDYPDIVNASRSIKKSELATCQKNGAQDIVEVKIGYDGLVIASSKQSKPMELTRKDIYLALAKQVPDPTCQEPCDKLVANPYKTWKQVNPALPDVKIEVLGPPFSSGSGEMFAEAVSESSCNTYPVIASKKAKNEKEYNRVCHNIREDGVYTEETGDMIVSRLESSPNAVGIINFSRLKANASRLQAAKLEGVEPTYETLASQSYPVSRPLFFYVKKAHVDLVPSLEAFMAEFTSEKAIGRQGYLVTKGLVAMSPQELKTVAADAKSLRPIVPDADRRL